MGGGDDSELAASQSKDGILIKSVILLVGSADVIPVYRITAIIVMNEMYIVHKLTQQHRLYQSRIFNSATILKKKRVYKITETHSNAMTQLCSKIQFNETHNF